MIDLTPTADELVEQQTPPEPSWEEQVEAKYAELLRDKRSEAQLGQPWCVAHQTACEDGPHATITLEQFKRRLKPAEQSDGG